MELIHWYPGHMAKAKKQFLELIKLLDIILEIRDARAPMASHNHDLEPLLRRRPCLIVLNKSDIAESAVTDAWIKWFNNRGLATFAINAKNGAGMNKLWESLNGLLASKQIKRWGRVGVVGIPNVGKSSVLNRLLGTGAAKTGNLPGITRGKQWVRRNGLDILDTPGLLPPKIEKREDGVKLALLGTIREEIIPVDDLVLDLLEKYGQPIFATDKAFGTKWPPEKQLQWFAEKRGFLRKGGVPDLDRAAKTLLKEFRDGRLARITLEEPPVDGCDG
jgi:ribosome biogenesis GTPase A